MRPFTRERLAARYRYIETLSPDGLVWELVRRSAAYQADYAAAAERTHDPQREASPSLCARWRLRFPGKSRHDR
ncbi:transcriptional regulator domain-containing protein [Acidiphilium multivorum]|uniref:transcriptional regulator domain-containing protein n=1 Tax=Acidiphilium multivorum TaxID=62140 RepID=UPI0038CFCDDA